MRYKILDQYNLINGTTDSSIGSINIFAKRDGEKRIARFIKKLGFKKITTKNLVFADQVHRDKTHVCQKSDGGSIHLGVDALITSHKNQVLVIQTADCVPVLIYAPDKKVVAAIHGGRKSLTQSVISKTISKMTANFAVAPENLVAAIGPHIRVHDYFLKPKSLKQLQNTKWKRYFIKKDKRVFFDLTTATFDEFIKAGVKKQNIEDCQICTFCEHQKYYSARKKEQNPSAYKEKFPCFGSMIGMKE